MKKAILLTMLLLAGCYPSPSDAFVYDEHCPHVCWLGINPGVTTIEEARSLLRSSNQINQKLYSDDETGYPVEWRTGQLPTRVGIYSENGIVKRISFGVSTFPLTMNGIINLLGEPEQISITWEQAPDDDCCISYVIYYPTQKAAIWVLPGNDRGPDPNDRIGLVLNIELDEANAPRWLRDSKDSFQPWLGYGHLAEYVPTREAP